MKRYTYHLTLAGLVFFAASCSENNTEEDANKDHEEEVIEEVIAEEVLSPEDAIAKLVEMGFYEDFMGDVPQSLLDSAFKTNNIEVEPEDEMDEFVVNCIEAINEADGEWIEGLRDEVTEENLASVAKYWRADYYWGTKNGFIALLSDYTADALTAIMKDGLDSPDPGLRGAALCSLMGNYDLFDTWMEDGWVKGDLVDESIAEYRESHP